MTFSHHPLVYLTLGFVVPAFFAAALMAAFWMRFDAPIWGAF